MFATACHPSKQETDNLVQVIDTAEALSLVFKTPRPYVLLNFYTTKSEPCVREIPGLIQLNKNLSEAVSVIFISIDDSASFQKNAPKFWVKNKKNSTFLHMNADTASAFVRNYYPDWHHHFPVNLLFTNQGNLVNATGMTDPMEVRMMISKHRSFYFQ